MSTAVIQPVNDNILTLLESNCSTSSKSKDDDTTLMTEQQEESQKQQILSYLNKTSPVPSFTHRKVSRLGPFLLLKTLGVGEFGKVKMARHVETGQTVAVKLVKKQNIDSSSQLEKIRMEIDILKTLNHPHIVKLLSVNETNTCIGMVIEFAQGGELFEYIYRQRYLKENEARRLFSQLISCVYYMHQKSIVHRDLKLENILLDHRGNLIVTDFGFANQFTTISGDLMSTSCGSPVYAAPELVMTGRLYSGTGVDIWSCGIILYAMLCGYLPFDDDAKNPNGDNIGRLYRYIMANKPKYPAHLSHDSKDVIGKMLIPDPATRCKIETIMVHPWLHKYKDQMSKSVQDLESEAQELKQTLLEGIEVKSSTEDNYTEDVRCDDDDSSVCSSLSSCQSETNDDPPEEICVPKDTINVQEEEQVKTDTENDPAAPTTMSPPSTPIPHAANVLSMTLNKKKSHASQQQGSSISTNMSDNHVGDAAVPTDKPVEKKRSHPTLEPTTKTTTTTTGSFTSSSSSSLSSPTTTPINTKRHTISTTIPIEDRPPMPAPYSSLRTKLLSSVKRRGTTNAKKADFIKEQPNTTMVNPKKEEKKSKRHSWQQIMHRHSHTNANNRENMLPLSPPISPVSPEPSKSVRLMSWLKNKSPSTSNQPHKQRHSATPTPPLAHNTSCASSNASYHQTHENVIPIAKPHTSLSSKPYNSNTPSRVPTEESLLQSGKRLSIESELRVHTGDMNRSALTSKQPMEVLLEINKILLILGIEVENAGGYKLQCIRRSTSHYDLSDRSMDDRITHLAVNHQPGLSLPIYGHLSVDNGKAVEFTVEICRFENLSGLFSVDIQCKEDSDNFAGYQFIGQKLLSLLHLGNAIRNTNFNVMFGK